MQGPEGAGILRLRLGRPWQPVPGLAGDRVLGGLKKVLCGLALSRPVAVTPGPSTLLARAVWVKGKAWGEGRPPVTQDAGC